MLQAQHRHQHAVERRP